MEKEYYKGYFICQPNMSGIYTGIQAGHSHGRLFSKYLKQTETKQYKTLVEWNENHETYAVLNGICSDYMKSLLEYLDSKNNPYPWSYFEEPDMNNTITSIAVVLPSHMCEARNYKYGLFSKKSIGVGKELIYGPVNKVPFFMEDNRYFRYKKDGGVIKSLEFNEFEVGLLDFISELRTA